MKQIIKGLTGILLAVMLLAGDVPAADVLRVQPTMQDFGMVEEGAPVVLHSVVENVGSRDVRIKNVRTN